VYLSVKEKEEKRGGIVQTGWRLNAILYEEDTNRTREQQEGTRLGRRINRRQSVFFENGNHETGEKVAHLRYTEQAKKKVQYSVWKSNR